MRAIALALAVAGCGSGATTDGGAADMAPVACGLIKGVQAPSSAVPGQAAAIAIVDGGSGRDYRVAWAASTGTVSPPTGKQAQWTPPAGAAVHVAEHAQIQATASADGCLDENARADVTIDWPDASRTVVIYNPMQAGSLDVATHYRAFRGIPDASACAIPYPDATTVQGSDFDAWLQAAMACVDAVGPRVHYIVPTFGVPYKLAGRVKDTFNGGALVTVSLDAVLTLGHQAGAVNSPVANAYLLDGDAPSMAYAPYVPFGQLRAMQSDDFFMVA